MIDVAFTTGLSEKGKQNALTALTPCCSTFRLGRLADFPHDQKSGSANGQRRGLGAGVGAGKGNFREKRLLLSQVPPERSKLSDVGTSLPEDTQSGGHFAATLEDLSQDSNSLPPVPKTGLSSILLRTGTTTLCLPPRQEVGRNRTCPRTTSSWRPSGAGYFYEQDRRTVRLPPIRR